MTSQITKRAHFVPASYLQFWSCTGVPEGRKSKIYWTNGDTTNLVKVEKIAHQNFLYSRTNPNAAEEFFQEFETDWVKFVKRLVEGKLPSKKVTYASFLLQCGFLLLRNPKMDNASDDDRIDAYKSAIEVFFKAVILNQSVPPTKEEALEQISEIWDMRFVQSKGKKWIASDNPVLTLAYKEAVPVIIFIPVTPQYGFLAVKRTAFLLGEAEFSEQDCRFLNSYVAMNVNRQIYSSDPIECDDIKSFKKWIDRRPSTKNYIDHDVIHIEPFNYPIGGMELSALTRAGAEED